MKLMQRWHRPMQLLMLLPLVLVISLGSPSSAEAGWWDWLTGIKQIPSEFDELKSKYDQMEQSFQETQEKYKEMTDKFRSETDMLRAQNDQLLEQNSELKKYNQEMTDRLLLLEQRDQAQRQQTKRIVTVVMVAIGLLVLYFVLTRVLRVLVWERRRL
ncbi:hypothetical protein [Paenibacillus sp. 1001270B_150601_E10]|uniref:hypothetical protein n=1 Tax=Paenibacillus sp. 1001270B_150601_E10 TaxID=2787079 RepID=UPI00189ED760|nr:hypothetical protein [Paenibacillus sp. 1001270B_150601_E10]